MEVIGIETHPNWKHVASGKLYKLFGYGHWKGGVNDHGVDMSEVVVSRPKGAEGLTDLDIVPGHYTVVDVKTADAAILQTTRELVPDDKLVCYVGDYYEQKDKMFARLFSDFFDGRFVKVDAEGKELPVAVAAKKGRDTMQQHGTPGEEH